MASEDLHGPPDPLMRARQLTGELMVLVTHTRHRAAELEAERDHLRWELARALTRARRAQVLDGGDAERTRALPGDMRAALQPALDARRRPRANLVSLMGGRARAG
jgi:hypothetical protein